LIRGSGKWERKNKRTTSALKNDTENVFGKQRVCSHKPQNRLRDFVGQATVLRPQNRSLPNLGGSFPSPFLSRCSIFYFVKIKKGALIHD